MYIAIHGARHIVDGLEVVEVKCPHCEYVWLEYSDSPDYPNYCPSCGKGLFEEEEKEDSEENNCEAGIYDCDTCPNNGDCTRQNEEG